MPVAGEYKIEKVLIEHSRTKNPTRVWSKKASNSSRILNSGKRVNLEEQVQVFISKTEQKRGQTNLYVCIGKPIDTQYRY